MAASGDDAVARPALQEAMPVSAAHRASQLRQPRVFPASGGRMFKHILVPTDGSELAQHAIRLAVELAATCKARIYAFHVVQPFHTISYAAEMLAATEAIYNDNAEERAASYLEEACRVARDGGIAVASGHVFDDRPHHAIVQAAKQHHCDLIVMASHGWRGMNRLLLGSETQKVLLNTEIPVLVCR